MSFVNKLGIKAKIAKDNMANKAMDVIKGKEQGLSELVVVIILIVIAVAVCLLFKNEIKTLMSNMMTKSNTQIDGMFTNALS